MGLLQLNQIKKSIDNEVAHLIDVSDVKDANKVEDARTTRGLAAWVLAHVYGVDPAVAAASVFDGFGDNGIDAIHYDAEQKILCLVQAKWSKKGTAAPALGDVHKFVKGVRDITNAKFDKFNERFQKHVPDLNVALSELDLRFHIVLAFSGSQKLSDEATEVLDDFLESMNDFSDSASKHVLSQQNLHGLLRKSVSGPRPTIDATLYDWGVVQEPHAAFYGQVDASEVASWYDSFGTRLFDDNIRHFLGLDSGVNESIRQTLSENPDKFWYFNNGITVLCQGIQKRPLNGATRLSGHFRFSEVSVVNGAQTVGTIGEVSRDDREAVANARVTVRFISLENGADDFATEITRGTNTQNRVERRDFVSLDPEQVRLAEALQLEGVKYAIKSGSETPTPAEGFTVQEATVSRACANSDPDLAVQAKREVGRLWVGAEDPSPDSQYRKLFNGSLSEIVLWRTVQGLRNIDAELLKERAGLSGRENLIGVHANRLLAHIVFQNLPEDTLTGSDEDFAQGVGLIPDTTKKAFKVLRAIVASKYADNYLASLFKNAARCRAIAEEVTVRLAASK
ncbi:AIPR family protein [Micrococcus luteus]|uniref:AIPR family protein n=1 Tax=Micrococcus luteus TaxID=1270 RepID=UPI000E04D371|nr:AIPR family protein [Micrococcus luteus]STY68052.1 AIPR protein [Micrococcus luteus]